MASANDQNEIGLPLSSNNVRAAVNLLPRYYRSDANKKFLHATIDQLIQPGTVKKVNGYIGRTFAKASKPDDIYLKAADSTRQSYQLEPAAIITDYLGNTTFFKDYVDHINHIEVNGGITNNHNRVNSQEMYSWNPNINWDKLVNFQNYYWLPYGVEVIEISASTLLNIETTIIGAANYESFANGMRVRFSGNIYPAKYLTDVWYVEGVGDSIVLVPESRLEITTSYTETHPHLFDTSLFDHIPFDTVRTAVVNKDYIVINKASPDRNAWARYNHWVHKDVISASAEANGIAVELDQNARAVRPIIEFNAGLKLANFGTIAKKTVDVIDLVTTDVFSTVAGSVSYIVDGISLSEGMRVLFTGDTDPLVANKIYEVKFVNVDVASKQLEFNASAVDVDANTIRFTNNHSLKNSDKVEYLNGIAKPILGITLQQVYYVGVVSPTEIKLFSNSTLTNEVDILTTGAGIHRLNVLSINETQISLVETDDSNPIQGETVLVAQGRKSQSKSYWFDNGKWKLGQIKTKVNQPPVFDLFDKDGVSFTDIATYSGTTFSGTTVFSYKLGTGDADAVLGFPISYQNIYNIGDITFECPVLTDTFSYTANNELVVVSADSGFLKITDNSGTEKFINGWVHSIVDVQAVIRTFTSAASTVTATLGEVYTTDDNVKYTFNGVTWVANTFPIDVYDNNLDTSDLHVKVYVDGALVSGTTILDSTINKSVLLETEVPITSTVTLKCYSKQPKNDVGFYEIPKCLQNNPLNDNISTFTLGEISAHVETIVENVQGFIGSFPGVSNLNNLGNVSKYGTKFVQHSAPLNMAIYHLGSKTANIISALENARNDYGKFKRAFLVTAATLGIDAAPKLHVDAILLHLSKDKLTTSPYYLSDMYGFGGAEYILETVVDPTIKSYPLNSQFDLTQLSSKSVGIYLNGVQLVHSRDYEFSLDSAFYTLSDSLHLSAGDELEVYEYLTTDGTFCPPTPSKLGLYPVYVPEIYVDTTYATPTKVIKGHDGSITVAFNDYRDNLILELETRIFNNIKVKYDPAIFDIYEYIPGYSRETAYSRTEFEKVLGTMFFQWATNIEQDYSTQFGYDQLNQFTYYYGTNSTPDNRTTPAFWRGIYNWMFDTNTPHSTPWEMIGFSNKPSWFESVYGPAPYTSNNLILWEDLANGVIRDPDNLHVNEKFIRPLLTTNLPVDEFGNLLSPIASGTAQGFIHSTVDGTYKFGDQGPVETAWRKSGYYPFALMQAIVLLNPNKVISTCFDRSRVVRNLTNQLVYSPTNRRIRLADLVISSTALDPERVLTSGLVNYLVDYNTSEVTSRLDEYKLHLKMLTNNLSSKLGGFSAKSKFNLLIDSKSPTSTGGVFVPEENYSIILNTSSPVKKIVYSGVMITKTGTGFEIRGYNTDSPYFHYYPYLETGRTIRIGGISESFTEWDSGQQYIAGKIVRYNYIFWRVKTSHKTSTAFDVAYYSKLAELPTSGGNEAVLRKSWNTRELLTLSYATRLTSIQDVVDFLQGYGAYLQHQGFEFDDYNADLKSISNWETAVKEFLFWTTQTWGAGSVLSVSPSATKLTFTSVNSVVSSVTDPLIKYQIFKVDGQPLDFKLINAMRDGNKFILSPQNTNHGIYSATLYLVQKEHVLVIDNKTMFGDTIYNLAPGYRQDRIKVVGYISKNWTGGFDIPGFIFDSATVSEWTPWTDYNLGDVVKYKEFYYSAITFLPGTELFEPASWSRQSKKPVPKMASNWDYRAEQFTDFYDLDTDNFDAEEQKLAQHLIGYQKRQYLENIINDDVSQYKFYQGMILEKGTQNALSKLFDVLSTADKESVNFHEEWAVRVGNYGASSAFSEIEFALDEAKFKLSPQPIELTTTTVDADDLVIRYTPSDLYVKPADYSSTPFLELNKQPILRTPGYVRYEDVTASVDTLSDITSLSIENFSEGSYVWTAFEGASWNVYRMTQVIQPFTATYDAATKTLQLVFTAAPVLSSVIGLKGAVNGFYAVVISNNTVTIENVSNYSNAALSLYKFNSRRAATISEAAAKLSNSPIKNDLLWIDTFNDNWAVLKTRSEFVRTPKFEISRSEYAAEFKSNVLVSDNGLMLVATTDDQIVVCTRLATNERWSIAQLIDSSPSHTAVSADTKMLAYAVGSTVHVCLLDIDTHMYEELATISDASDVTAIKFVNDLIIVARASSVKVHYLLNPALLKTTIETPCSHLSANITGSVIAVVFENTTTVYTLGVAGYVAAGTIVGNDVEVSKTGELIAVSSSTSNNRVINVYLLSNL